MAHVKIRYYVVKKGHGYYEPSKKMRAAGIEPRPLGKDGPKAWAIAESLNHDWDRIQRGEAPVAQVQKEKVYLPGTIGAAWTRYRKTDAWKAKAPATRRKDWDWAWKFIEPIFADVPPTAVEVEQFERFRTRVLKAKGKHTAHRVTKIWRAMWKVMVVFKMCEKEHDPSKTTRNSAPKGRTETWSEIEIIRLAKVAWRTGYRGLAALLAVAWDTQFAPVDCRLLTPGQRLRDARGDFFDTSRGKTGKAVIGTLSKRTVRVLDGYIARLGFDLHADAEILRNRSGAVYSADTLGDDFRDVRELTFPGDTRQLLDIRRSGAVEALAGEADPGAMAAKMGNSIDKSKKLQETYLPKRAATVRLADEARKRGRKVLKENE